jgi:DNA N-6-adenine-methyltransferase Dam
MMKDEWLTPPEIIEALGPFDLDPCSPINRPWGTAKKHYTIRENGLWQEWDGRVWLNPPYGRWAAEWLERLAAHRNGIALLFARTETHMFFNHVWPHCDAVLFIDGRLHFHHIDGTRAKSNSGAPSVLIAYGSENAKILQRSGIKGKFLPTRYT